MGHSKEKETTSTGDQAKPISQEWIEDEVQSLIAKFNPKIILSDRIRSSAHTISEPDSVRFVKRAFEVLHDKYCPRKPSYEGEGGRYACIQRDLVITLNEKTTIDEDSDEFDATSEEHTQDKEALEFIKNASAVSLDANISIYSFNPPGGHGAGFVQRSQPVKKFGMGYVAPTGSGDDQCPTWDVS